MRPGSTRILNRTSECRFCGSSFACADPKASRCPTCRGCRHCGKPTRAETRTCRSCAGEHLSPARLSQLARVHDSIRGDRNPSKRAEVRAKLSSTKRGDLNPARIHRAQFAEHIAKYRPRKVSKLESVVADVLSSMARQHKVGWYLVDLADPERKIAIEIQGCWFHCCQTCFPGSPTTKTQRVTLGNDKRKHPFLKRQGWRVVEVWEHTIREKTTDELREHCARLVEGMN